jgi:predicted GNAT family acetyltransferase
MEFPPNSCNFKQGSVQALKQNIMGVNFTKNETGLGKFFVSEGEAEVARMEVRLSDRLITVLHTEVDQSAEGKGYAKIMLSSLAEFAREKQLKVKPLCPFVYGQFKKHPELYGDIWMQTT